MIWLRWAVQQARGFLGWQGIIGLVLIVSAVAVYAKLVVPMDERIAQVQGVVPAAYDRKRELARIAAEDSPGMQLQAFYRHFSSDEPLTDWLGRIYGIGDDSHVSLRQAEYRVSDEHGLHLTQYQIVLPVSATYPQLKKFIAAVLAQAPLVSLDQMTLQRRKVGDATIDAQLQFTLYLAEKS